MQGISGYADALYRSTNFIAELNLVRGYGIIVDVQDRPLRALLQKMLVEVASQNNYVEQFDRHACSPLHDDGLITQLDDRNLVLDPYPEYRHREQSRTNQCQRYERGEERAEKDVDSFTPSRSLAKTEDHEQEHPDYACKERGAVRRW
nr:hypothetical protein [Luteibacter yeojuensis]